MVGLRVGVSAPSSRDELRPPRLERTFAPTRRSDPRRCHDRAAARLAASGGVVQVRGADVSLVARGTHGSRRPRARTIRPSGIRRPTGTARAVLAWATARLALGCRWFAPRRREVEPAPHRRPHLVEDLAVAVGPPHLPRHHHGGVAPARRTQARPDEVSSATLTARGRVRSSAAARRAAARRRAGRAATSSRSRRRRRGRPRSEAKICQSPVHPDRSRAGSRSGCRRRCRGSSSRRSRGSG